MPTTEWIIQGTRDEQCLRLVTNAIQDLPGIGCLEISLDTGAASVQHSTVVSDAEVRAASRGRLHHRLKRANPLQRQVALKPL